MFIVSCSTSILVGDYPMGSMYAIVCCGSLYSVIRAFQPCHTGVVSILAHDAIQAISLLLHCKRLSGRTVSVKLNFNFFIFGFPHVKGFISLSPISSARFFFGFRCRISVTFSLVRFVLLFCSMSSSEFTFLYISVIFLYAIPTASCRVLYPSSVAVISS